MTEKPPSRVGTLLALAPPFKDREPETSNLDNTGEEFDEARPFKDLVFKWQQVGSACTDECVSPETGHTCGCPHDYDFEAPLPGPPELWSRGLLQNFLAFISRLPSGLAAVEFESRLDWWWRGENRELRRAIEKSHRVRCERGRGVLINRTTGQVSRARCKSWRDCPYCAWVYGVAVERLFKQVRGLRAFVVFTMPPDLGDWSNPVHLAAQARSMRRLRERLFRAFDRRFSMLWTREHNTHCSSPSHVAIRVPTHVDIQSAPGAGRLHLNVLWDEDWVDQAWLSEIAAACGFGAVVHISRIGASGRHALRCGPGGGEGAERYATKCLRYASKDLSQAADWPKGTRRWGASRAARAQMRRPERNPDWFWSPYPVSPVCALEPLRAGLGEPVIRLDRPDEEQCFIARSRLERGYPAVAPLPDWLVDEWRHSRAGPAPPATAEPVRLRLFAPATTEPSLL